MSSRSWLASPGSREKVELIRFHVKEDCDMGAKEVLQEGKSVYDQSYVGALTKKWGKLLEGVQGEHTRNVMAVLFENQSQYLQNLNEETRSTNVGSFMKFVFPVLRRVWPSLIANEIVSVQPQLA